MSGDFSVGEWRVQPSLNRLTRGSETVRLEPKVMQVLVCLAEGSGEVVTRDELIARVWPDVFVTDDVLHRAIRELRRVFGDSTAAPRYIETIRKRGYRLVQAETSVAMAEAVTPTSVVPVRSQLERTRWSIPFAAVSVSLLLASAWLVVASRGGEVTSEARARFVPLVSGPLNETDPAISPDGQRVAFVQREPGDGESADIYVRELADGQVTRLVADPANDRFPVWSPDGRRLAFVRMTATSCELLVRDVAGTAETRVAACGNRDEPRVTWTPDGRGFLTSRAPHVHSAAGWRIVHVSLDGSLTTDFTDPPAGVVGDHTPVVSPDGRQVAFIRHASGGAADIYVAPVEGGAARRVTADDADITGIDWSDEGRSLVYSSDRAGGYSLWRVGLSGGQPTLIAGGATRIKHPVADRSGRRVVYESWNYEINVWESGLLPGAPAAQAVTRTSDLWNLYPEISPDGQRVAYVSTQSGDHELWIANRDGAAARQLTHHDRGTVKTPRWSPDGRRVAYLTRGATGVDIEVIDVDSGHVTPLTSTTAVEVAPGWSHDGSAVLFGLPAADGGWNVWSVAASEALAAPRQVIANAIAAQASSDGQWLYFTRPNDHGVWRVDRQQTRAAELIVPVTTPGNTSAWRVTAGGVFFLSQEDDLIRLYQAPLSGGTATAVATLGQFSWPGFSISPDGRHALYARWDRRESNILSVEY